MKKKNWFYLSLVCILCLLLVFTGCTIQNTNQDTSQDTNQSNNPGNHPGTGSNEDTGTYYTVTFDSRGGSAVASQRVREGNPAVRPQTPEYDGHFFTGWFNEDNSEWDFDKDRVNSDITLYAGWQAETDLPEATASLTFVKEGNSYTVTDVGEETVVVIPAEYEGLPVTKIQGHHGTGAFADKTFTTVIIPDTVTEIGQNTFYGCKQLTEVKLGANSGLTTIGNNAFSGCSALKAITIPKGVTTIGNAAFNNCASIEAYTVASENTVYRSENGHLIEIATDTLIHGANNSDIPQSVRALGAYSFQRINAITELNIPKTITKIGNSFINASTVAKINYAGTQAEWEQIEMGSLWNYGNRNVQVVYESTPGEDSPKVLVVYFSATNTTKGVAEAIHSQISGSDIYAITPAVPYTPADLNYNTDCRANREQNDPNARPEISGKIENIEQYDVIFIGYPIWWGQAPKIIYTFFESYDYDFDGVTIIPFCTSGSSGIGSSATNLHSLAPNAIWKSGARISGNNVSSLIAQMN